MTGVRGPFMAGVCHSPLFSYQFEYHVTCCVLNQKKDSESMTERMRTQITMVGRAN